MIKPHLFSIFHKLAASHYMGERLSGTVEQIMNDASPHLLQYFSNLYDSLSIGQSFNPYDKTEIYRGKYVVDSYQGQQAIEVIFTPRGGSSTYNPAGFWHTIPTVYVNLPTWLMESLEEKVREGQSKQETLYMLPKMMSAYVKPIVAHEITHALQWREKDRKAKPQHEETWGKYGAAKSFYRGLTRGWLLEAMQKFIEDPDASAGHIAYLEKYSGDYPTFQNLIAEMSRYLSYHAPEDEAHDRTELVLNALKEDAVESGIASPEELESITSVRDLKHLVGESKHSYHDKLPGEEEAELNALASRLEGRLLEQDIGLAHLLRNVGVRSINDWVRWMITDELSPYAMSMKSFSPEYQQKAIQTLYGILMSREDLANRVIQTAWSLPEPAEKAA